MSRRGLLLAAGAAASCGLLLIAVARSLPQASGGIAAAAPRRAGGRGAQAGERLPRIHPDPAPAQATCWARRDVVGRSAQGRPIGLLQRGDPAIEGELLVFGCIHGDECAASGIQPLANGCPDPASDVFIVPNLNPDGLARRHPAERPRRRPQPQLPVRLAADRRSRRSAVLGTAAVLGARDAARGAHRPRAEARGDDLVPPALREPGRWSAPGARASRPPARYARLAQLPFRRLPWPAGTAPNWQNHRFPGTASFVVELPRGRSAEPAQGAARARDRAARPGSGRRLRCPARRGEGWALRAARSTRRWRTASGASRGRSSARPSTGLARRSRSSTRRHWRAPTAPPTSSSTTPPRPRTSPRTPSSPRCDALDRFDRRRPFAPWLHRIVVNRAIDWARREALRREVGDDPASTEPRPRPPQQVGDELMEALAQLPPEQRAVVVLRHLLEYTPGEIARMLELPRGTVNSRLRRGARPARRADRGGAMNEGGCDAPARDPDPGRGARPSGAALQVVERGLRAAPSAERPPPCCRASPSRSPR